MWMYNINVCVCFLNNSRCRWNFQIMSVQIFFTCTVPWLQNMNTSKDIQTEEYLIKTFSLVLSLIHISHIHTENHSYTNIDTNLEVLHYLPKGRKLNTTEQMCIRDRLYFVSISDNQPYGAHRLHMFLR